MTAAQLEAAESIVVLLANGAALVYPPAAPLGPLLKGLADEANKLGIIPTEIPAAQLSAQAAGRAADRASAITSDRARRK